MIQNHTNQVWRRCTFDIIFHTSQYGEYLACSMPALVVLIGRMGHAGVCRVGVNLLKKQVDWVMLNNESV